MILLISSIDLFVTLETISSDNLLFSIDKINSLVVSSLNVHTYGYIIKEVNN